MYTHCPNSYTPRFTSGGKLFHPRSIGPYGTHGMSTSARTNSEHCVARLEVTPRPGHDRSI
jgi:hypothetical protein